MPAVKDDQKPVIFSSAQIQVPDCPKVERRAPYFD
jgi:hypothetical protein